MKKLKSGKAHGSDCLLNEYFLESVDILAPYLCDLFNAILNSGYFPEQWTEGIIIPLHKKGDKQCASNYRGITLLSCLSKIFTSVLNNRLEKFCKTNDTISDAQFGFRKGRSTVDAMFALLSTVQNYLCNNKRLYVAFVDLKKCFDSIYRNALWLKLFKAGVQGKLLSIIKCMYERVKSCVKSCNNFSDFFEYSVGLRQG
ncbi:MAG: reverse transcriptase family protein, partial [Candidatus Thiodiazotropha endolucinida]|nr:reverse transcriptase family protein [Candidatus Thiodiazotropha taylori]MCW4260565.1 reverse transcriptase family protein [Candidatus Thiodiazotropha endolucinida]